VSLSHPKVIETLNRYFVPVYLANEDYRGGGSAPPEEVAELRRIHREGHAAKLSVGTVHAYVLSPEGRLLRSMHVAQAARAENLLPMLEATVTELAVRGGEALAPARPQSGVAPAPGEAVLHVVARYLERKGSDYVPIVTATGDWSAFPGEDWVRLTPAQWAAFLPPAGARPGDTWEVDRATAAEIGRRLYPPTENNDLRKNRIDDLSLRATVVAVDGGRTRARLAGSFRMQHAFYHKEDGRYVEGSLVGVLEAEKGRLRDLKLVTDGAFYRGAGAGQPFGATVRLTAPAGSQVAR
jgi:hypothetical protein